MKNRYGKSPAVASLDDTVILMDRFIIKLLLLCMAKENDVDPIELAYCFNEQHEDCL